MSIPSQLPQLVTAARSSALQALALQAGQVLEGKVLGPAPGGGTQVEIGGQRLNLLLPTLLAAGAVIKLEVQATGPQIRLAIQAAPAPGSAQATVLPSLATSSGLISPPPAPITAQVAASSPPTVPGPVQPVATGPASVQASPTPPTISAAPVVAAVPSGAPASVGPASAPATSSVTVQVPTAGAGPPSPGTVPPPGAPLAPAPSLVLPGPEPAVAPAPNSPVPLPATGQAPAVPLAPGMPPQQASSAPSAPATPNAVQANAADARPPGAGAAFPTPAAPNASTQAYARQATVPSQLPSGATPPLSGTPPATSVSSASAVPAAPSMATTPQAALVQMVQAAVPRQGSIASLTTALTAIAGKVALPEPVIRAAQQVLAGRLRMDSAPMTGAQLQKAVLGSGVFQEAKLAAGTLPLPQTDMKSALLSLRQSLGAWLGQQAAIMPAAKVPPPLKGNVPRARSGEVLPLEPSTASTDVGKQLLDRTEAALSRIRLHQNASLPDPTGKQTGDWSLDLPVTMGQYQTLLHIQIHRDQQGQEESPTERGWQMRFAINLPELGEVGAQVSLRGGGTGVMLWATDAEAAQALDASLPDLREALAASGLQPGTIFVRHGEPAAPPPARSGHIVDSRT